MNSKYKKYEENYIKSHHKLLKISNKKISKSLGKYVHYVQKNENMDDSRFLIGNNRNNNNKNRSTASLKY